MQTINLNEWSSTLELISEEDLLDEEARDVARALTDKGILEIIELKNGLSISSNSYVGRIQLSNLQINVQPKLNGMPLYQLLRYAYGLRDLKLFNMAEHEIGEFSFFDLLIYELYIETEDLLRRGIHKSYSLREQELTSPRGRIDINKLGLQAGMIKDTLPCQYFSRDEDNVLNQTLLGGLILAIKLVQDKGLKIKLQNHHAILVESIKTCAITRISLHHAQVNINRLTVRYTAVLEIINILYESQSIQLEDV